MRLVTWKLVSLFCSLQRAGIGFTAEEINVLIDVFNKESEVVRINNSVLVNIAMNCFLKQLEKLPEEEALEYLNKDVLLHQDLGLEEYIEGDGVCLVEWAEFIQEVIPDELLKIEIEILENEERMITITPIGSKYIELLKVVKSIWDIR